MRDLDTGRVLNVSRGKGEDALKMFASRLRRSGAAAEIECVAMDMANAFANFAEHNLPNALIVFDHFHVAKMINDIIDKIRRAAMAKINAETRQALKELNLSKEERNVVRVVNGLVNRLVNGLSTRRPAENAITRRSGYQRF